MEEFIRVALLENEVNRYEQRIHVEPKRALGELGHPDGPTDQRRSCVTSDYSRCRREGNEFCMVEAKISINTKGGNSEKPY